MIIDQYVGSELRTSLLEYKYYNTIPQSLWYTCGPAALATYLKYFLNFDVDEDEIISMSIEEAKKEGEDYEYGLSAATLSKVAKKFNVDAKGYKVPLNQIADFFDSINYPALMYLTKPEKHFVLVIPLNDKEIAVMDPSSGLRREVHSDYGITRGYGGIMISLGNIEIEDLNTASTIKKYLDSRNSILNRISK